MNKTRWLQLSPLLDELLDLEPGVRLHRLAELRDEDETIAEDLDALLGHLTTNERDGFLERPPGLNDPGGMAGRRIGAYTVERELGQGGMGSVWLARRTDGRYDGMVAVKFLNMALASGGGAARFAREGSILARLAHPNIARLVDAGVTSAEGQPYLVLEYIAGQTIDRYCESHALGVDARVRLFLDVLAAVEHAHNRLILHRDIKPSNILVTDAGEVKLLDFGIAKLLDDATASGAATELTRQAGGAFTPRFAAPEQVRGQEVTTATDVYALGVLLYVLLGRLHPTSNTPSTPVDQMRAVIEYEPKRLSEAVIRESSDSAEGARLAKQLRGDLDNIVAKALKKSPAQRYANAAQFADDLRRYLADEPVSARRDAFVYRTAKFVRRHRLGVAAGTTVVLTLAAGISVALWQAREAHGQRVQAEGLIEFMLGDLRKKLQPVGRLDVLDAVGEKTLAYYATQNADQLDAASLGRRARALHLIGEIHDKRGRLADAQSTFVQAENTTAQLVARSPNNGQRLFDHAQSVYWVGYIAWRRGNAVDAEIAFRKYHELAKRLSALDPANLDWRLETAYALMNLGQVHVESAHGKEALTSFDGVLAVLQSAVAARPELNFDIANAFGAKAIAYDLLGDYAAAIDAQQAKAAALYKLPGVEKNRQAQRLLADANYEQGRLQLALGHAESGMVAARRALEQLESLLALDPSNLYWLERACFARVSLAEIQLALGDRDSSRKALELAASDTAKLIATDASHNIWQVSLRGLVLGGFAALALAEKKPGPVADIESYLAGLHAWEIGGKSMNARQIDTVSGVELALGDLLFRDGRRDTADQHWAVAAKRLASLNGDGSSNPRHWALLGRLQARLGRPVEAGRLAERLKTSTYRHPDQAALVSELAHDTGSWQQTTTQRK